MSWIGIECDIEAYELERWGRHFEELGASDEGGDEGGCNDGTGGGGSSAGRIGSFLRRCSELVGGGSLAMLRMDDRMREIERRAVASIERKRNEVLRSASSLMGDLVGDMLGAGGGGAGGRGAGVDEGELRVALSKAMTSAGIKGWEGGRIAGVKNGGIKSRRIRSGAKKRKYVAGSVVRDRNTGQVVSSIERQSPDVVLPKSEGGPSRGGGAGVHSTLRADKCYGTSFNGWCGVELRKMGFKMKHVARALGVDTSTAWRCISGYERYWKRQRVGGVMPPEPSAEWESELEHAILVATGRSGSSGGSGAGSGSKRRGLGAPVVLNGTKDCGVPTDLESCHTALCNTEPCDTEPCKEGVKT